MQCCKSQTKGESKRASGQGFQDQIGQTDGQIEVIIKEKYLISKYTLHMNIEVNCNSLIS